MNIFVAKLDSSTTQESLESLFGIYGEVSSAKVIYDRETGRSKGYGFVEMPNDEDGQSAIDSLNEQEFEGSVIVVKRSEPREGGQRRSGGFRGGDRRGGGGGGFDRRNRR